MIKCEICGKEYKNYKGLSSHIRETHKVNSKDYYDTYLIKDGEGYCITCSNPTVFKKLSIGYSKYCCSKCVQADINVRQKQKESLLKNYGVDNPAKSEIIQTKIKKTNLERYGVENVYASTAIREKCKQTLQSNYNVDYPIQNPELRKKILTTRSNKKSEYAKNHNCSLTQDLFKIYGQGWYESPIGKEISFVHDNISYVKNSDIYKIELYKKCHGSYTEYCVYNYLTEHNIKFEHCTKDIIIPYELDFYIPELKIGIECNGYYHTDNCFTQRDQNSYHTMKYKLCEELGIKLIYITDDNINDIEQIK